MGRKAVRGAPVIATTHPLLAAELVDQELATTLSAGSGKRVRWRCAEGHEWTASLDNRTRRGDGCPYCSGRRPIPGLTDLASTHPLLAAELVDQELATTLSAGSSRKVAWRCAEGHEWSASVARRASGSGCPYCAGTSVWPGFNDLLSTHPLLAAELVDQELATTLSAGSGKPVLWRCAEGHEWTTRPTYRTRRGDGCPYCSGKRAIPGLTDLASTHPLLAAELVDQELATTLSAGSGRKVAWRCAEGHEWTAVVISRSKLGNGCPYCSGNRPIPGLTDLASTHPLLAAELVDQELATTLSAGSDQKPSWRCAEGHEWVTSVSNRTRGNGCPYCSGKRAIPGLTDLASTHPLLAAELVDQELATTLTVRSNRKVAWRCAEGHEWTTAVFNRTRRSDGCPYCGGQRAIPGLTDMMTTHPLLAAELVDQELATTLSAGSGKRVRWRCAEGHEWTQRPATRLAGVGCPYCSGTSVWPGFNDLLSTHPLLAAELVDQELATTLSAGSNRKVAWRCAEGHEWTAVVISRSRSAGSGCPECAVYGFSAVALGWLYLLRNEAGTVYKFGITNNLDERLAKHAAGGFPAVVETWLFEVAAGAQAAETALLRYARAKGWKPPMTKRTMSDGWSETLSVHDCGPDFSLAPFVEQAHADSD